MTEQEKYMKAAMTQAKKAYALGEVPIGCVIVHEGKINRKRLQSPQYRQKYTCACGNNRH